ncbi:MAG: signal peptidase II [Chloroflexota bacterium]|nr:signal peptidase II [Chloroflexota bacterium]
MSSAARNRLLLWCGATFVLLADQLSKLWILQNLREYKTMDCTSWLTPVFSLTHLPNTGVAFGLFPQFGGLLTILSSVIIIAILWIYRTLEIQGWPLHLAFGMQIGGALGNLLDRLLRGSVVDFIDVNFWPFQNFAVFNLADSAIVVGVGILLLCIWLDKETLEGKERALTNAE